MAVFAVLLAAWAWPARAPELVFAWVLWPAVCLALFASALIVATQWRRMDRFTPAALAAATLLLIALWVKVPTKHVDAGEAMRLAGSFWPAWVPLAALAVVAALRRDGVPRIATIVAVAWIPLIPAAVAALASERGLPGLGLLVLAPGVALAASVIARPPGARAPNV